MKMAIHYAIANVVAHEHIKLCFGVCFKERGIYMLYILPVEFLCRLWSRDIWSLNIIYIHSKINANKQKDKIKIA